MGISILTLNGMEMAYQHLVHKSLFDDISLPEGLDSLTLAERIFIRCGEFSVMHSDPYYFKWQIDNFFKIHLDTFTHWMEALEIEYNPLENYDRFEFWEDHGTSSGSLDSSTSGSSSSTNTNTAIDREVIGNSSVENKKAAFNSSSYSNYEKSDTTGTLSKENGVIKDVASGSYSDTVDQDSTGKTDSAHTGRIHGNIGVTTSQQMLQAELDIRKFNIFKEISNLFADEFCLQVY